MSTTTTLPVQKLTVYLDSNGKVDWDKSLDAVMKAVDSGLEETRLLREDVLSVLNANSDSFINEDVLISQAARCYENRQSRAAQALGETYDFTISAQTAYNARLSKFIEDNKGDGGLFISVKGRGGGIQTISNAEAIKAARLNEKLKKASK